ncbi:hypothetical protein K438DRAFT_1986475 [Mycena galopus ATCC 62051]|nr:hypothetical protein K438DRAFT_1986475 [Mycena galopus ATCC 62051]
MRVESTPYTKLHNVHCLNECEVSYIHPSEALLTNGHSPPRRAYLGTPLQHRQAESTVVDNLEGKHPQYVSINDMVRHVLTQPKQWRGMSALQPTPPSLTLGHAHGHSPDIFGAPPPAHPTSPPLLPIPPFTFCSASHPHNTLKAFLPPAKRPLALPECYPHFEDINMHIDIEGDTSLLVPLRACDAAPIWPPLPPSPRSCLGLPSIPPSLIIPQPHTHFFLLLLAVASTSLLSKIRDLTHQLGLAGHLDGPAPHLPFQLCTPHYLDSALPTSMLRSRDTTIMTPRSPARLLNGALTTLTSGHSVVQAFTPPFLR